MTHLRPAPQWSFILDGEEQMIFDAIGAFLADKASPAVLRSARRKEGPGFDRAIWEELAALGQSGLLVPAERGGSGLSIFAAALVQRAVGRNLSRTPLLSSAMLAASALARGEGDICAELLGSIADGSAVVAFAHDEGPRHARIPAARIEERDGGFLLNAKKTNVIDAGGADHFLVSGVLSGGSTVLALVRAETAGVDVVDRRLVDSSGAAAVTFRDIALGAGQLITADVEGVLDIGVALAAAELVGVAEELFSRTNAYLKEREQFGVPIGSYQALQHRAAQLYCQLDLAWSAVIGAARAIDEADTHASYYCSVAAAKAGQVGQLMADEAIQLHGGVGMTDEFDIGMFVKRAAVVDLLFGDSYFHLDRVARLSGY